VSLLIGYRRQSPLYNQKVRRTLSTVARDRSAISWIKTSCEDTGILGSTGTQSHEIGAIHSVAGPLALFEWWHLLSLDAPTIAALWAWTFAGVAHVSLPFHAPLLLALGTWLLYVADRILDGIRLPASAHLRKRHYFHARHRSAFLTAATVVGCILVWLILTRMSSRVRGEDAVLLVIAMSYFVFIHVPDGPEWRTRNWFPKELAVGIIFAAATAAPAWSRTHEAHTTLMPAVLLFAALCWMNCVAIETWEHSSIATHTDALEPHVTTRFLGSRLPAASLIIALAGLITALYAFLHFQIALAACCIAALSSALLFRALDSARRSMSSMQLRIAVDAALLTPLFVLPFIR
jgi:hypothetical protein